MSFEIVANHTISNAFQKWLIQLLQTTASSW